MLLIYQASLLCSFKALGCYRGATAPFTLSEQRSSVSYATDCNNFTVRPATLK